MGTLDSPLPVSKPLVQSSTVYMNAGVTAALGVIAAFWPAAATFLSAHPTVAPTAISIVNVLWRVFVTKQPISGVL